MASDMADGGPAVVVGCDGSTRSDAALRFAAEEARLRSAALIVVTAYPRPFDPDLDDFDTSDAQLQAQARDRAEAAIRRALLPGPDVAGHRIVTFPGDPAKALLAQGDGVIMIVIGHGDRPMVQRLLGHLTGRKLVRRAHVPVVVVPAQEVTEGHHDRDGEQRTRLRPTSGE